MLKALTKHYPDLLPKYESYFAKGSQMPKCYRDAFDKKMKEFAAEYGLRNTIIPGAR